MLATEAASSVWALEAAHTSDPALDAAMILFKTIVEVCACPVPLSDHTARSRPGRMPIRCKTDLNDLHAAFAKASDAIKRWRMLQAEYSFCPSPSLHPPKLNRYNAKSIARSTKRPRIGLNTVTSRCVAAVGLLAIATSFYHTNAAMAQASPPIAGTSFDCGSASTSTERQICLVPDLSHLDIEISTAYPANLAALDKRNGNELRASQRLRLRQRDTCGGSGSCLHWSMNKRIAQLLAKVTPEVLASVLQSGGVKTKEAGPVQPAVPTILPAPPGDGWGGAYTCGGADYYMRLTVPGPLDNSASVTATIEFGPGPETVSNRGLFNVAGHFSKSNGALHLEAQQWIHQPWPAGSTFGLDGKWVGGDFLVGKVLGPSQCTAFRVWHHRQMRTQNPNGLVLKMAEPSDDDCRNYANWLATSREFSATQQTSG